MGGRVLVIFLAALAMGGKVLVIFLATEIGGGMKLGDRLPVAPGVSGHEGGFDQLT